MTKPEINPSKELIKAVNDALPWNVSEAQDLLIRKKILKRWPKDGASKNEALSIICTLLDVGERQAYNVLAYMVRKDWVGILPSTVVVLDKGREATKL